MRKSEYEKLDGLALAELIRRREVRPAELMETAIELAEERDPPLNALCYTRYDEAVEVARKTEPKGTFGGLPFLLKDSGLASRFLPSSVGSRLFADTTSKIDSTLTERFAADGFLPFGRTTVPEFCMAPTTEALQYGAPTRNPWDRSRSSGGSSGGAAVAVATGIVPIAHGSDGGGSIRIPAACCGVFGLKPSRGLLPVGPSRGEAWGGLAVDGVLTRTVRDTAAALDGTAGMEVGAPYAAPTQPVSYLAELGKPFDRPIRIAKWTTAWDGIAIAPECLEAVARAEKLLTDLGHEVVEAPLPHLKYESFVRSLIELLAASVTLTVNGFVRHAPDSGWEQKLEPAILDAYHLGKSISAETYALGINRFHSIARLMENYMSGYDFILTPTLTQLPARLGTLSMDDDFVTFRSKVSQYTTFLAIINASGQPAANLPLYRTETNLPVGVQIIGRFGGETGLLRLSAQLEEAAGWAAYRPPS